jgi:uncharacterized SAM-binding protein YcdF (DUF218 family)
VNPAKSNIVGSRRGARDLLCTGAGALLVADAVFLMAQRLFNLGVLIPLVFGACLLAVGLKWKAVHEWLAARPQWIAVWRWAWAGLALWLVTVAGFWAFLAQARAGTGGKAPAAIVVLGSGTPGGKASPVLAARLDVALREAALYPDAAVVVSGGVDFTQTVSEGQIMGDYLRARGLAAGRIVQEERSTSTEENLLFSAALLLQRGLSPASPIHLVTSDFHTLRASWIARRAGYTDIVPVGAETPLYVRYNAWLREYFAVIGGFLLREFA